MSTDLAAEMLAEAEAMGLQLRLVGGKVKAAFPSNDRTRVAPVLERLRTNRQEVADVLRRRGGVPPMPPGVRLVSWKLNDPPIRVERWSVVTEPALFAQVTLEQLGAALAGKQRLAGHWSVAELRDRLEQVGVIVSINGDAKAAAAPTATSSRK